MSFWYGSEAPPNKMPIGWVGEACDRPPENSNGATINLLEEWRENVEEE